MASKTANDIASELVTLRPRHDGPRYHAPSDLESTSAGLKRVLIVGSCQAGEWAFDKSNPSDCPCDVILTNDLGSFPDLPPRDCAEYDFQVVQLPLLFILEGARLWALKHDDIDSHRRAFDTACAKLELQLEMAMKWNREQGLLTFVTNFMIPQQNPMGRLFPRYDLRNPGFLIEKINERLAELLAKHDNCYLLDIDMLSAIYGKRFIQDDHLLWISQGSIIEPYERNLNRLQPAPPLSEYYELRREEFLEALWWEFLAMYRTSLQRDPVKLVVVDLDDTLWKGVQGESESVGPEMLAGWPMGMVEALGYLKKRGILLAIISKNEEEQIRNVWPEIFGGVFDLDDFAAVKVNFLPKAQNMAEILAAINVLPDSVVFIDDNPVEREAMKSVFPEIRILPPEHYYWRRILLWSPETQVRGITGESEARTEMVQNQLEREKERVTMSREKFLSSLEVKVKLKILESEQARDFSRAFELLNKTNQFNTTGQRWTMGEFKGLLDSAAEIFAFHVEDRFTVYGLVGVIVTRDHCLEQFVLSCRVIGMDIETAVVGKIIDRWRMEGAAREIPVTAKLIETEKNLACRGLWTNCGFTFHEGERIWRLNGGELPIARPEHVAVSEK